MHLQVKFFILESGRETVREWLKNFPDVDRELAGEDIKTVRWGWPLGMPLVRSPEDGLWEIRTDLKGRIARVFFCTHDNCVVLLHGFSKKTMKTPDKDIRLAKQRMKEL